LTIPALAERPGHRALALHFLKLVAARYRKEV
jgi:hypothetical protein